MNVIRSWERALAWFAVTTCLIRAWFTSSTSGEA